MYSSDASKDAPRCAAPQSSSLEEKTARAIASGKLDDWEEPFCRSQLARLEAGRELTDPQREKLQEILGAQGGAKTAAAVNVPTAAAQRVKLSEDLEHDEAVLRDRIEGGGHVPPQLVLTCARRRERLKLATPDWLQPLVAEAVAAEKKTAQPKRKKLSQREVEARLKKIADQSKDDDAAEAVA